MAEHWWRAYDGSIDHPKLLKLSDAMHRAWFTLQCIASANGGVLPPAADIALRLRMKPSKVASWIVHLVSGGLLDNDDGVFRPHNWDERQYKTDTVDPTAASRAKNYRDRKRDAKRDDRDATVTHERPDTEQKQNRAEAEPARDDLKRRTGNFQQAIVQAFATANSPNLPETSRAGLWLSQGYQEDICLAVISELVRKKPSVTTLNYFDRAIAEAHASKAPPRQAVAMKAEEVNWDDVLTTYKKMGHWSKWAGPDLSSPACRAPPEMLAKYGLTSLAEPISAPPLQRMQ